LRLSTSTPDLRRHALVVVPQGRGRGAVVRALRAEGMEVTEARGPFEAVTLFLRRPAQLIVVSLDGLRGRDRAFLRELRRFSPDLRVLLLVPEGRRPDVARFLEAGADATLAQPFFPAELRLLARALLRSDAADPLTGLPNRGAYELGLSREISRAEREGRTLGLGLIDVDHFKRVNTDLGYRAADLVLREVARRLREAFRVTDVVARWGGEEFAVLLSGLPTDETKARDLGCEALERARAAIKAQGFEAGPREPLRVTISGGLALFPHDAKDAATLFDVANQRIDLAKAKDADGRNRDRIVCGDPPADPADAPRPGPPERRRT
jgi:diguanylate cyclase (GGDEF)-like protein